MNGKMDREFPCPPDTSPDVGRTEVLQNRVLFQTLQLREGHCCVSLSPPRAGDKVELNV